jgi:hypothetical protein
MPSVREVRAEHETNCGGDHDAWDCPEDAEECQECGRPVVWSDAFGGRRHRPGEPCWLHDDVPPAPAWRRGHPDPTTPGDE